jgi:STE24 endopeptidase
VTTLLIVLYLVTAAIRLTLTGLNIHHRRVHGGTVPAEFASSIDEPTLQRSSAYSADRESFGLLRYVVSVPVILWFLFGGGLATYDAWTRRVVSSNLGQWIVFFVGLSLVESLLELPFDAWATFRIEQRHGFNRSSVGLFLSDWVKGTLIGTVLVTLVTAVGAGLYFALPQYYWLCFWGFGVALATLLMLIAPTVIEPLFIKATPLENAELATAVRQLAERVGVRVTNVLQVDASRRSSHSNAYFTGIGRVKRVVLFDTLLSRLSESEILAVLAHELGHWKLRHVTQRLVTLALFALLSLYAGAQLLAWNPLPSLLGLAQTSVPALVVMLGFVASLFGFLLTPISAYWSRRHENQADAFAVRITKGGQDLASALAKLAQDNLTNLHPHPLYAAFYFSHPPACQRVRRLNEAPAR